jgi:sulfur carrier protein
MQLQINGQVEAHPDGLTVADLLGRLDKISALVAVEVNRQIVPRSQHAQTTLKDNDKLEIVTLVGGG